MALKNLKSNPLDELGRKKSSQENKSDNVEKIELQPKAIEEKPTIKKKPGRPVTGRTKKTAISVRIPDEILEKARVVAEETCGGNLTKYVERLIIKSIEENEGLF